MHCKKVCQRSLEKSEDIITQLHTCTVHVVLCFQHFIALYTYIHMFIRLHANRQTITHSSLFLVCMCCIQIHTWHTCSSARQMASYIQHFIVNMMWGISPSHTTPLMGGKGLSMYESSKEIHTALCVPNIVTLLV